MIQQASIEFPNKEEFDDLFEIWETYIQNAAHDKTLVFSSEGNLNHFPKDVVAQGTNYSHMHIDAKSGSSSWADNPDRAHSLVECFAEKAELLMVKNPKAMITIDGDKEGYLSQEEALQEIRASSIDVWLSCD